MRDGDFKTDDKFVWITYFTLRNKLTRAKLLKDKEAEIRLTRAMKAFEKDVDDVEQIESIN